MQRFRIKWLYTAWAVFLMVMAVGATAWFQGGTGCMAQALTDPVMPATATAAAAKPVAPPTTRPAADFKVSIDNFAFKPKDLTVPVGATLTWVNHDDVPHTATSTAQPKAFDSKALDTDDKYSFTFKEPGTYRYYCKVHTHMTGTVIVK